MVRRDPAQVSFTHRQAQFSGDGLPPLAFVDLADLLEPTARRRVETLRQLGVGTLVLDECHHLASLWGTSSERSPSSSATCTS